MDSRIPRPAGAPLPRSRRHNSLAGRVGVSPSAPNPRASKRNPTLKADRTQQTEERVEHLLSRGWDQVLIEKAFEEEGKLLPFIMREKIWMRLNGEELAERLRQEHSMMWDRSWDPFVCGDITLGITRPEHLDYMGNQMNHRIKNALDNIEMPSSLRGGSKIETFAQWEYLKPEIAPLYLWTKEQGRGRDLICKEMLRRYGHSLRNQSYSSYTPQLKTWFPETNQISHSSGTSTQSSPWIDVRTPFSSAIADRTPQIANDDYVDLDANRVTPEDTPAPLKYPLRSPALSQNGPASVAMSDEESDSDSNASLVSKAETIASVMSETLDAFIDVSYMNWSPSLGVSGMQLFGQNPSRCFEAQQLQQFQTFQDSLPTRSYQQAPINAQGFEHSGLGNESNDKYSYTPHNNWQSHQSQYFMDQSIIGDRGDNYLPAAGHQEKSASQVQKKDKIDSGIEMGNDTHDNSVAAGVHNHGKPFSVERPATLVTADSLMNLVPESHMHGRPFDSKAADNLHALGMLQGMRDYDLHQLAACINEQPYDQTMTKLADALKFFNLEADTFVYNSTPGHIALSNPIQLTQSEVVTLHWVEKWLDFSCLHIDEPNADGETLLHLAAKNGFHSVVIKLLQRGATPESRNNIAETPYDLCLAETRSKMGQSDFHYARLVNCVFELRKAMRS